jgi:hypothetical protein
MPGNFKPALQSVRQAGGQIVGILRKVLLFKQSMASSRMRFFSA